MDFEFAPLAVEVLGGRIDELLAQVAGDVAADARRNCPVRTGATQRSIVAEGNRVYIGGPTARHWPVVEFGSAPHAIRPRSKRALFWEGAEHPVGVVHHPGTPEFAPMRLALYRARLP